VTVDPVVSDAVLCDFSTLGWPDRSVREDPVIRLARLAGAHVDYAVLQARDEVAAVSVDDLTATLAVSRARIADDRTAGPAPGVAVSRELEARRARRRELDRLDAADLEALLDRDRTRSVLVDAAWVEQMSGLPRLWDRGRSDSGSTRPPDVAAYGSVLDGWLALGATGPLAWVDGRGGPQRVRVSSARCSKDGAQATNGPRILLTVNGGAPGDLVPAKGAVDYTLEVQAPSWIPLTVAELVGSDGTIASFDLAKKRTFSGTIDPAPAWVIATVSGGTAEPGSRSPRSPSPARSGSPHPETPQASAESPAAISAWKCAPTCPTRSSRSPSMIRSRL
jgi:hypothetical protein